MHRMSTTSSSDSGESGDENRGYTHTPQTRYEYYCSSHDDVHLSTLMTTADYEVEEVILDHQAIGKMISLEEFLHSSDFDSSDRDNDDKLEDHSSDDNLENTHFYTNTTNNQYLREISHYTSNLQHTYLQQNRLDAPIASFTTMNNEVDPEDYRYYSTDSTSSSSYEEDNFMFHHDHFGFELNPPDILFSNDLEAAISWNDVAGAQEILNVASQQVEDFDKYIHQVVIMHGNSIESVPMLKLFLVQGVDVMFYVQTRYRFCREILQYLVEVEGIDVNGLLQIYDHDISTFLEYAVMSDVLLFILSHGFNINRCNEVRSFS